MIDLIAYIFAASGWLIYIMIEYWNEQLKKEKEFSHLKFWWEKQ